LSRVAIFDVVWGAASPAAAFLLRDGMIKSANGVTVYCGVALLASLLVFQWFQTSSPISRFYSIRDAFDLLKACALIVALSAVATFVLARLDDAPRSIPILQFMVMASGLLGMRILLRLWNAKWDSQRPDPSAKVEHVLLLQASRLAWFFTKMVEELAPGRYQIVAILDEEPKLKNRSLNGYPIIGTPNELEKVLADYATHGVHVDKVVLAAQADELTLGTWNEVWRVCQANNIGFEVLPERLMSKDAVPCEEITVAPPPPLETVMVGKVDLRLDRSFWKVKRVADVAIAAIVAILICPMTAALCALVILDVGIPVVFWQRRVGRSGAPIHLYKFRTLQTLFDRQTKERREVQRSSPIGRFLQKTRLDELPQLWNIFSGDMSLVGPRPLLPVDQPENFSVRLSVRPGLTGWAQVCGGKLITADEKNALDEWYIRHASLRLDAIIVLRTVWMLLCTGDRRDETAIATALRERAQSEPLAVSESIESKPETKKEPSGLMNRVETASV
jgi:lipopolysaccharide/colanic/teichoic acid biosynthesis glycosyltransferase